MRFLAHLASASLLFSVTSCEKEKAPPVHPILAGGLEFGPYALGGEKSKATAAVRVKHFDGKLHWIATFKPTDGNDSDFESIADLLREKDEKSSVFHYQNITELEFKDSDGFKVATDYISSYIEDSPTTSSEGGSPRLTYSGKFDLKEDLAIRIADCGFLTKYTSKLNSALTSQ